MSGILEPFGSLPRTVAVVILTAALVLSSLYLLWQARKILGSIVAEWLDGHTIKS